MNPRYSSQRFGHVTSFTSMACGYEDHADINAAKNILVAGLRRVGLSNEFPPESAAETFVQAPI